MGKIYLGGTKVADIAPVTSVNSKSGDVSLTYSDVGAQESLGFWPVQQGGGIGQNTNKVYLGWDGSKLRCTIDSTDVGGIITTDNISSQSVNYANSAGSATDSTKLPLAGGTMTGNLTINTNSQPQLYMVGVSGNWDYIRLHNGSNFWDIASNSSDQSGAIQFRANGSGSNRIYFTTGGASSFPSSMYLSFNGNQLFMGASSSIRYFIRNDGSNTYHMVESSAGSGTWSSARPIVINNSTGVCNINGNAATASSAGSATYATYTGNSDPGSYTLKNTAAGTGALTSGSSSLTSGYIYLQYT